MRPDSLGRDERGATLTEFGLLIPVLALLLVGSLDVGHSLYMRTLLDGAVQKAARDSGLESGTVAANQTTIDNRVRTQLRKLGIEDSEITIRRRYYRTFSAASAAQAEPFTDNNGNGRCDAGEPYTDQNNNSVRDADGADGGQGGAMDTVVYTVSVNYERMFPLASFIGVPDRVQMSGSTVMSNQPYGDQGSYTAPTVRNCPAT